MPIIQGPHTNQPSDAITSWGLAQFTKGQKAVTESHFHDADEFVCMISGRMHMRSEGVDYVLEAGDVLATWMGDEHEVVEILEDTTYFWFEGPLRGRRRPGHLHSPGHHHITVPA